MKFPIAIAPRDTKTQLQSRIFLNGFLVQIASSSQNGYRMKTVNEEHCRVISVPINPLVIARQPRITSHARSLQRETRNSVREISLVMPCIIVPTDARPWKHIPELRHCASSHKRECAFSRGILIEASMNWSSVSLQLHAHRFHRTALQRSDKEAT